MRYGSTSFYCYNNLCSGRTKESPWVKSACKNGYIKKISKKGNTYKKRCLICFYCNEEMTRTMNLDEGY